MEREVFQQYCGSRTFTDYTDINDKKDYCLKSNELLHAFNSFCVVYCEERENDASEKFDPSVYFVGIKK